MTQNEARLMDHLFIKVNGTDLATEAMDDIVEVTVDSSLHYPDMVTILLHDESLKWISGDDFQLGQEIEISAQPEEGGRSQPLFKGEITALEPDFAEGTQASLMIRAYDKSHRLHRGTHTKAYLQTTDSDLAQKIAQEMGLQAKVDATAEVYDCVIQNNLSHMAFLTERARRIGYDIYVAGSELNFKKAGSNGSGTLELEWGKELRTFRPRLTLVEQVDEVIVRGWNPKTREAILGKATRGKAEPEIGIREGGGAMASKAFNKANRVVVDRMVKTQREAELIAQALLDEISGTWIEADGLCYGNPALVAGKHVKLNALGNRFSGTYFVTTATHIYRADSGYATAFTIHGRRPDGLFALLDGETKNGNGGQWAAPVVGVVTNNKDPEERGRVKLKFPWMADDLESDWARVVAVGAGPERGFYCLPEVNDEVLVTFEHGDVNRPYVLGGLWNGQDKPPAPLSDALEDGKVRQRIFKTRAGHKLTFNDTDRQEAGVIIETAKGHKLILDDEQQKVTLVTANGNEITLDDQGRKLTIESKGDLEIKSATNLTIEATGNLTLKGQAFTIQGNANGEVKSSGVLTVQGSLVKIN